MKKLFIIAFYTLSLLSAKAQSGSVMYTETAPNSVQEWTMHFTQKQSLYFSDTASTYKKYMKEEAVDGSLTNYRVIIQDPEGNSVYKDYAKQEMRTRFVRHIGHSGAPLIVEEILPKDYGWELLDSTKTIGGFTCSLAKTVYKRRLFYAWFTYDVAVPHGPWKLGGLPGLIIEAYDSEKKFHFIATKISVPSNKTGEIVRQKTGDVVTWEQYVDINVNAEAYMAKKMQAQAMAAGKTSSSSFSMSSDGHIEALMFIKTNAKD